MESSGKPDSPELPEGVEVSLNNGEEKEEDHDLKNAPAATKCNLDWDYSRCNICKNPNNPRQNAPSPHTTETYKDSPVPWEEAWELFSWHIPEGIWKRNLKPLYHLVQVMEVCARYFGGIVKGPDRPEPTHPPRNLTPNEGRTRSRFANDCCGSQIMSMKTVWRFFDNAMLTRHYCKKCACVILDGRYSAKQLESIKAERQS